MKLLYYALVVLLCTTACTHKDDKEKILAHADEIEKQVLPLDTTVRTGVLSNGLTYYVCPNTEPEQKAYFRLVVKAGSLVEEENERGIAHFVEHMMLKGSKHFPTSDDLHGFMRRNGFPLGDDSNAYTWREYTEYVFNAIPSDNKQLMDSCLLFLHDVAGRDAFIRDADVESERNVIVEEWRYRFSNSSSVYMNKQLFNDSLYANRMPIGDMNIIRNCPPSVLRDFYKRWYQPQNMAVIVVGDIDATEMEKKIRNLFGDLKRGETVVPPLPKISDTEAPKFYTLSEPTAPLADICIRIRLPYHWHKQQLTVANIKELRMQEDLRRIFEKNLIYLKNNYDAVYNCNYEIYHLGWSRNRQFLSFYAITAEEDWEEGLRLLFQQIEKRRREGFEEDEITRPYSDVSVYNKDCSALNFNAPLSYWDNTNSVRTSAQWVDKLIAHFMGEDAITSNKSEMIACKFTTDTYSKDELNDMFCNLTDGRNMYVYTTFPSNVKLPEAGKLEEIYKEVKNMTDEELKASEVPEHKPLGALRLDSLKINPVPGTVKKTIVRNDSITEARLSNGVKVIFWKKKKKGSGIRIKFVRPGGFSVLSNKDYFYRNMYTETGSFREIIPHDGFPETTGLVREWQDDMLYTPVDDTNSLKHALKYFYVRLTPSEIDPCGFKQTRKHIIEQALIHATPRQQAIDRVNNVYSADPRRWQSPTPEEAKALNTKHFMELVREHTSNYNGSLFVIQGYYNIKDIMPAVLKYIGSLPSKPKPAHYKVWPADHYKTTNTIIVEKYQNSMLKCGTVMDYTWEVGYKYTPETNAHNDVLCGVLNNLLFNTTRLQNSDVYASSLFIYDDYVPINKMRCHIYFSCNPKERERIASDVDRLMHRIAEGNLITQELIDGCIKERERTKQEDKYNDINTFVNQELYGMPMDKTDLSYIRKVTPQSLKAHLKRLLKEGNLHIGYYTTE